MGKILSYKFIKLQRELEGGCGTPPVAREPPPPERDPCDDDTDDEDDEYIIPRPR